MNSQLSTKNQKNESHKNYFFDTAVDAIKSILQEDMDDTYDLNTIEIKTSELFIKIREVATTELIMKKEPTKMNCPSCDAKMKMKDKKKKTIKGFSTYVFHRRNFYCENCKKYIRPLDNILNCQDYFSPKIKESMLLLGQRIPFAEASEFISKLLNVSVNHESIQEHTEKVGKQVHTAKKARVGELINKHGHVKKKHFPEKIKYKKGVAYLQMDGCMAQTREEGWKECRNGVLFSSNESLDKKYFSVFNSQKKSLEEFKKTATAEAHDFEFYAYETQVFLGDGAHWIWDYADTYHPDAIKILDFYHASEYLGNAFASLALGSNKDSQKLNKQIFNLLKNGKIDAILTWLHKQKSTEKIQDCIRYYENNKKRMDYGAYKKQGLDIGSGVIESANRSIIQVRMKHSGMHWGKKNVQSMASLRCAYLSGEWENVYDNYILKAA